MNIDLQTLKALSSEGLEDLATEMRSYIIDVLSKTGGHLGSNLGAIELTIALHKVFNSPEDKILFDTSHQCYTHKILTGRAKGFPTIRQTGGLCGFTQPEESPHDHFHAGHAGTALSLALGLAHSRDLSGESNYVLPVIGDAALTCGLTLEALNNFSSDLKGLIIILNDNSMAISQNVGAITNILSRLINSPRINKFSQDCKDLIEKIPHYGSFFAEKSQTLLESLKHLVSPASYFEQFGLSYVGPIDGHDLPTLVSTLEALKDSPRPVLLHLLTVKGKGMPSATQDPIRYHGVKAFCPSDGSFLPAPSLPTFPKVFGDQLVQMAKKDASIVLTSPAMLLGSSLVKFSELFPKRCFDVGIAESHAITFSGALGKDRKHKVVASIYATFLQRALDNLFHDVCLQEIPLLFAIDRAGISGPDGSTHHGIYDLSFLRSMPNMIIAQPRNGQVLRELLLSAFSWGKPTAIRYPNISTKDAPPLIERKPGEAEILCSGSDILIIALGHMCTTALELQKLLHKRLGIKASVLDPVFVAPLDEKLLRELLPQHQCLVTLEEHSLIGGLGAAISAFLRKENADQRLLSYGVPQRFLGHGAHKDLIERIGLTPSALADRIEKELQLSLSIS